MNLESFSIKGLARSSFVDWDGNVTAVFFTGGCNFRCPFCHNIELVLGPNKVPDMPMEEIDDFLRSRQGWIELVITGGEPTLHPWLPEFCAYLKGLGFKVKLDSNGSRPQALKEIVDQGLVDYIAMDIKSAPMDYARAVAVPNLDFAPIKQSVEYLLSGAVEFEFRSTVMGDYFTEEKARIIAEWISEAPRYRLQPFECRPDAPILDPSAAEFLEEIPVPLKRLAEIFSERIPDVRIRGQAAPLPDSPVLK